MEVRIEAKEAFTIAGMTTSVTMEDNRANGIIPKLMNEFFGSRVQELANVRCDSGGYGLFIDPPNYDYTKDPFQWIAGVQVSPDTAQLPDGMIRKNIDARTYAVVTYIGPVSGLSKAYDYFYSAWLSGSGYGIADSFGFEYYTGERSDHPDNVVELHFPVYKR
ncbi:GyrI-like domain-containing protein [Paenibacillus pinihumi]|uniref:GyrI-like domain-containing protein n=1 Tax=Paenibacillus pinihumi TaxID=669462 RepID=UPI00040DC090|nr:GyrI-like domain-containing protein [Paenibacillus pinihumi]